MSAPKVKVTPPVAADAPKAYRYARFSSSAQRDGMSLERQQDAAEHWAAQHGMVIDDSCAAFIDSGVSASKGKNIERGALSKFLQAVAEKDIDPGSYLLIESVSRFSRLVPRLSTQILYKVVEAGIKIVFLETGEEYSRETIDTLGRNIMFTIKADSAAEYAKTLKGYVLASWQKKRAGIAAGETATRILPYWLQCKVVNGERGPIEPNPTYAPIVERIFREYVGGKGKKWIAHGLNADKVPTPATAWRHSQPRPEFWLPDTIGRTLANRAVTGVFQSMVEIDPGFITLATLAAALKRKRKKAGEPINGYYPRIISNELFEAAARMRDGNRAKAGSRIVGRLEIKHILARLATCPACGGSMSRVANTDKAPRYVCAKTLQGGACVRHLVYVADVEKALVANADALGALAPTPDPALTGEIETVAARFATIQAQLAQLNETVEGLIDRVEPVPAIMSAKLTKLESDAFFLDAELATLRGKATATQPNVIKRRVASMVTALKAYGWLDTAPAVNAALVECFEKVVIAYATRELVCHWKHGPPPAVVKY